MIRWRVGGRWYAVALLANPLLLAAILWALSALVSPAYAPGFQAIGLFIGLVAGYFEEIGWTGFATPRLLKRNTPLKAGLMLGLTWALWHMLADFSGNIHALGTSWPLSFAIYWILPLTAYRILMTWVYANTRSVLVAQLMHAATPAGSSPSARRLRPAKTWCGKVSSPPVCGRWSGWLLSPKGARRTANEVQKCSSYPPGRPGSAPGDGE